MSVIKYHLTKFKKGLIKILTHDTVSIEFTMSILLVFSYLLSVITNAPIEKEIQYPKTTLHIMGGIGFFLFIGSATNDYSKIKTYRFRNFTTILSLLLNLVIIYDLGPSINEGTNIFWLVVLLPNIFCFISTFVKYNYYKNEYEFRFYGKDISLYNFFTWSIRRKEILGHFHRENKS